jgi:hypothetical protein
LKSATTLEQGVPGHLAGHAAQAKGGDGHNAKLPDRTFSITMRAVCVACSDPILSTIMTFILYKHLRKKT